MTQHTHIHTHSHETHTRETHNLTAYWVGQGQLDAAYAAEGADVTVVYLRQAIQGSEALRGTTLRAMGLSG